MSRSDEAVALLQGLLRIDTVNPPGNERPAQELIAVPLRAAGFELTTVGEDPERPNLVARLRGHAPGPVLGLLSHVDTVGADPAGWEHGPWSGALADGHVWGRGALDMKCQTAAEVVAACSLAHEGWRPARGDLLVISVADEEVGGTGAAYVCAEHPELVRCDYLLNEGGGELLPLGDERAYSVSIGEKGVYRFTLSTDGIAGHASVPGLGDNALLKLAPLLEALATRRPGWDVTAAPRALLDRPRARRGRGSRARPAGARRARAGSGAAGRRHDARDPGSDDGGRLAGDERDPRRGAPARGLPHAARAWTRPVRWRASARCWARTATGWSSPSVCPATRRPRTRR